MYKIPHMKVKLVRDRVYKYPLDSAADFDAAKTIYIKLLDNLPYEEIIVLYVNGMNKIIGSQTVSMGGLNGASVTPRDIFRGAIACNASALFLGHNHPSGNSIASSEDIHLTKAVMTAGKIIGISILDHLVVAGKNIYSIRDNFPFLDWN
jgi:DNA repair protein RadC